MKRAFTLIELLVVIAIIAILAAILFPVFAQAKVAAKKTAAISNNKQIGLGIIMYTADYDDKYPRNDGCVLNSSLNSRLNDGTLRCGGAAGFAHRMNHFSWQKWVIPYIKNVDIFEHPLRQRDPAQWNNNGQLTNGIVLNLAITGALDTYNRAPTFPRQNRVSFLGGSQSGIPRVAETMILAELPMINIAVIPGGTIDPAEPTETLYPVAIREFWRWKLMDGTVDDCINRTRGTQPDGAKVAAGGVVVGFTDGHTAFLQAGRFLAQTPSKEEFLQADPNAFTSGWTFPATGGDCHTNATGNYGFAQATDSDRPFPDTTIDYPLWGLGN